MSARLRRLAKLETAGSRQHPDAVQHFRTDDGWILLGRQGKAIFALPDNGRGDRHA